METGIILPEKYCVLPSTIPGHSIYILIFSPTQIYQLRKVRHVFIINETWGWEWNQIVFSLSHMEQTIILPQQFLKTNDKYSFHRDKICYILVREVSNS